MDYEKAYKEAIEIAKEEHEAFLKGGNISAKAAIERIFPELCESEDERIKNEIIAFVEQSIHRGGGIPIPQEQEDKWIAWLEKQGENEHIDESKPKFNVGDWITNGEYTWNVIDIQPLDYILQLPNGVVVYDAISYVDEHFHFWTIQDAKDGDILEFGDHGRLVVGIASYVNKTTGKVDVNCLLENNNFKVGNYYNLDTIKPHPATEEQCDLLFQKMHEAGYEWDAEKKKLKKIEQKPTDKIKPKFKVGEWIINNDKRIAIPTQILEIEKYGYVTSTGYTSFDKVKTDYHLWTIQDAKEGDALTTDLVHCMFKSNDNNDMYMYCYYSVISDVFNVLDTAVVNSEYVHPATKEQRDLLFQKMKEAGYEWDAEKKELKKIEQASTWSKEDKKYIAHIIAVLEGWDREHVSLIPSVIPKCIDWLKSLKPNIH